MRVLLDTSVLISAIVEDHPDHERSRPWLQRSLTRELDLLVSAHSLAELFSVLTRYPLRPRIPAPVALRLIRQSVEAAAEIITLSADDYFSVLERLSAMGLAGGIVYDALIGRAAEKARADRLLTLNLKDFRRLWPEVAALVATP